MLPAALSSSTFLWQSANLQALCQQPHLVCIMPTAGQTCNLLPHKLLYIFLLLTLTVLSIDFIIFTANPSFVSGVLPEEGL